MALFFSSCQGRKTRRPVAVPDAVLTTAMPPNNVGAMTLAERRQIAARVEGHGRERER